MADNLWVPHHWNYSTSDWTTITGDFSSASDTVLYIGGIAPPAPAKKEKPAEPTALDWLDKRVGRITSKGRKLLEVA